MEVSDSNISHKFKHQIDFPFRHPAHNEKVVTKTQVNLSSKQCFLTLLSLEVRIHLGFPCSKGNHIPAAPGLTQHHGCSVAFIGCAACRRHWVPPSSFLPLYAPAHFCIQTTVAEHKRRTNSKEELPPSPVSERGLTYVRTPVLSFFFSNQI